jgi:hypothetical protein
VVFITSLAGLNPAAVNPILVADHDLFAHPDTQGSLEVMQSSAPELVLASPAPPVTP